MSIHVDVSAESTIYSGAAVLAGSALQADQLDEDAASTQAGTSIRGR
jgi:hypothetical protein